MASAVPDWNECWDVDVDAADLEPPQPFNDRAFPDHYFAADAGGHDRHDHYLFCSPNEVCLFGLAPGHPVRNLASPTPPSSSTPSAAAVTVERVEFTSVCGSLESDISEGGKTLAAAPVGKSKKDARRFRTNTLICTIFLSDGRSYPVASPLPALLYEVNERLLKEPDLLRSRPESDGYIAIINPFLTRKAAQTKTAEVFSHLLSPSAYAELLAARSSGTAGTPAASAVGDDGAASATAASGATASAAAPMMEEDP